MAKCTCCGKRLPRPPDILFDQNGWMYSVQRCECGTGLWTSVDIFPQMLDDIEDEETRSARG